MATPATRFQPDLWDASRKAQAIAIAEAGGGEYYRTDFAAWLRKNWTIFLSFERRALRLILAGRTHCGPGMIFESIRYASSLRECDSEFKLNTNYKSCCALLFEAMHAPQHQGFFRKRIRRSLH